MPRPSFFLVGAPKCGTTSLCHYLNQHPDIFIPEGKELDFFGSDLDMPRPCKTDREYLENFANATELQSGERSTWYLYSRTAACDIYRFNSDAKIIVSIRNPVEMVYSLFRYRRYVGMEWRQSFADVLATEQQYTKTLNPRAKIKPRYIYLHAARFYDQIRRYVEIFGMGSVHVVVFEDLKRSPDSVYRAMLKFLGVSDDFRPIFRPLNRTGRIRSERFQARIAHLPPPLKRVAYAFPRAVRRPVYRALCRLNTSYAPPPPLDPDLRRRLDEEFRPDLERLGDLLGRDLTHWVGN